MDVAPAALIPDASSPGPALTLRLVTNTAASRLLRLPAELRDHIYRLVLREPRLWERRHKPTCADHNPAIATETPPFAMSDWLHDPADPAECWRVAHARARRQGLGLLAVNRQVHAEASPVFWRHATFCFRRGVGICWNLDGLPAVWPRIRSVSIMNFDSSEGGDILVCDSDVLETLALLPNLVELELQAPYLELRLRRFLLLRALRTLRVVRLAHSYLDLLTPWEQKIYVALPWELQMPQCSDAGHGAEEIRGEGPCQRCLEVLNRFCDVSKTMLDKPLRYIRPVTTRLMYLDVPWTEEEACIVPVKLRQGEGHLPVRVWGLPTRTLREREAAGRKRGIPAPVTKRAVPVRFVTEEEEEAESARRGRSSRSYRCRQERAERVQAEEQKVRRERRDEEVKREAKREKTAEKKAMKVKQRGEKEMQAERKAARKRAAR